MTNGLPIRHEITRLAHSGLDTRGFSLCAARVLRRAVPFDGFCLLTLDPATMLPTGEIVENGLPAETAPRLTEIEFCERDVNKFTGLARSERLAATLSEATAGEHDRSLRHRELKRPHGFGDELRAVLVDGSGVWGALTLLREAGRADFEPRDTMLVASLSGALAEGLQRAILSTPPQWDEPGGQRAGVGVLLLCDDLVEAADDAAELWLDDLHDGQTDRQVVPPAIRAVALQARAVADGACRPATARVRTRSGRWLVARGSLLGERPNLRVAVTLEPAGPPELAPLIADALGLTERERLVTELVAQGHATNAIASRLHLSAYTVQDHLKSIFDKVDVSTRGKLVARLFFQHYQPRLRPPHSETDRIEPLHEADEP